MVSSFTSFLLHQASAALLYCEGGDQLLVCIQMAEPFVSRAEVMTVSIHATSGWALVISLRQSVALPTQPRRLEGRAGETDSFPSLFLSLSPPLFLPICVSRSHSNSPFVKAAFHHGALAQPATFSLAPVLPAPLCVSSLVWGEGGGGASQSHLPVPLSRPVIYLHEDTPAQMISRHFLLREALGLPVSPQAETICPQSFARMPANSPLLTALRLPLFSPFYILSLAPRHDPYIFYDGNQLNCN